MKAVVVAACICAATVVAPTAAAAPCQGVLNQGGCQPAPWNGQQLDTWNMPNTYGGWVNTPVRCNPVTTDCEMWAQP